MFLEHLILFCSPFHFSRPFSFINSLSFLYYFLSIVPFLFSFSFNPCRFSILFSCSCLFIQSWSFSLFSSLCCVCMVFLTFICSFLLFHHFFAFLCRSSFHSLTYSLLLSCWYFLCQLPFSWMYRYPLIFYFPFLFYFIFIRSFSLLNLYFLFRRVYLLPSR